MNFYWNTNTGCGSILRLEENNEENKVVEATLEATLYPNPSNNIFNLTINTTSESEYSIYVMDITGKILLQRNKLIPNQEVIFGEELSAGVYFVRVIQNELVQTVRIIKVK